LSPAYSALSRVALVDSAPFRPPSQRLRRFTALSALSASTIGLAPSPRRMPPSRARARLAPALPRLSLHLRRWHGACAFPRVAGIPHGSEVPMRSRFLGSPLSPRLTPALAPCALHPLPPSASSGSTYAAPPSASASEGRSPSTASSSTSLHPPTPSPSRSTALPTPRIRPTTPPVMHVSPPSAYALSASRLGSLNATWPR
jgi:hypothetical protein